jgi:hypothetical protein
MNSRFRQLVGVLLFAAWFWWAHGWADTLAVVSPIHWPLLLPQLVLEGVPAAIGFATSAVLFLNSRQARSLVLLLCVSTAQSVALWAATPEIGRRYDETVTRSRHTWQVSGSGVTQFDTDVAPAHVPR